MQQQRRVAVRHVQQPLMVDRIGQPEARCAGLPRAEQIAAAKVEPLALGIAAWHKELAPAGETTVVFRDSAFADDVAKTNLTAILQQHGLENVRSL